MADQRRAAYRLVALAIVLAQAAVVAVRYPMEDRWFLHPDDHSVSTYAPEVLDHGTPTRPWSSIPLSNVSEWLVAAPPSSHMDPGDDRVAGRAPIAVYYLYGPAASASLQAVFWQALVLSCLALAAFYALAERLHGGLAACVALAVFAFAASMLFWGNFALSNVPAIGLLCLAMFLLAGKGPVQAGAGAFLLGLCLLLRSEYILLVGAVGAARALDWWLHRRQDRREALALGGGIFAAAVVVVAVAYATYGTWNLLAVAQGTPSGETVIEQTVVTARSSVLESNLAEFGLILFLPMAAMAFAAFLPRRTPGWSPEAGLAAGAVALAIVFLTHQFTSNQPALLFYSQTRYMIPVIAAGALAFGKILTVAAGWRQRGLLLAGAAILIAGGCLIGLGAQGLAAAGDYTESARQHDRDAQALPERTAFVGDIVAKMVVGRATVRPDAVPEEERRDETVRIALELLEDGWTVAGSMEFNEPYRVWIDAHPRIVVEQRPGTVLWVARLVA